MSTNLAKPKMRLDILGIKLHDLFALCDGQLILALTKTAQRLVEIQLQKSCLPLSLLL